MFKGQWRLFWCGFCGARAYGFFRVGMFWEGIAFTILTLGLAVWWRKALQGAPGWQAVFALRGTTFGGQWGLLLSGMFIAHFLESCVTGPVWAIFSDGVIAVGAYVWWRKRQSVLIPPKFG